jgi:hypothetical protein
MQVNLDKILADLLSLVPGSMTHQFVIKAAKLCRDVNMMMNQMNLLMCFDCGGRMRSNKYPTENLLVKTPMIETVWKMYEASATVEIFGGYICQTWRKPPRELIQVIRQVHITTDI